MEISVIGAGSWGTVLSRILADNGHTVVLWARNPEKAAEIQKSRRNADYLPDMILPPSVTVTSNLELAAKRASVLVFVVPSKGMHNVAEALSAYTDARDKIILSCTKGFDMKSHKLMTDVLSSVFPKAKAIAALSGPNLAREIAARQPAATVIACKDASAAITLQDALINSYFRPYTSSDLIGVQLGGSVKNCYALMSGMMAGIGMGENCQAGLITRGLAEITRLGIAMGAQRETFFGLAGVGDLIATCSSPLSRNHSAGVALASGKKLEEVLSGTKMVIEGIDASKVVMELSKKYHVEMPLLYQLWQVLYDGKSIREAIHDSMNRKGKKE